MLRDFDDTHKWNSTQRRAHLATLDKRYAFRMFMGPDGRWRFAVDEEPTEPKPPDAPSPDSPPPDPEAEPGADANKTISIQLQELSGRRSWRRN